MLWLRKIKKIVGGAIRIGYKCIYRFIPIHDQMIMFISFHGRGYSDNPRAIYEEMRRDERFKDYTLSLIHI